MFVGLCRVDLHFPASRSLKAKRSLVQRLKGRIAQRFQASVAEVDHQDLWQRSRIGVAVVGGPPSRLQDRLAQMRRMVEQEHDLVVIQWAEEIQKFEPDDMSIPVPEVETDDGLADDPE
jgi:uncharacterized protein YlxP (DUF503 family)